MAGSAVFLDRDGVINEDLGYVHAAETFRFISGVFKACSLFQEMGFRVIVITNQLGIARGVYTMEQFVQLTRWMKQEFQGRGTAIDAVYVCPHHPDLGIGAYRCECRCREPQPGLIDRAALEWDLSLSTSVLVSGKWSGIQAGSAARVGRRFLLSPSARNSVLCKEDQNCEFAESLLDVALRLREEAASPGHRSSS